MSLSAFLVFVALAAFFVACLTSRTLTEKERFFVHIRATAVSCAIFFGGLVGMLASDYAPSADYAWQIGIALGVSIYGLTVHFDRKNQRRIKSGEEVPYAVLSRYVWMLPRAHKSDRLGVADAHFKDATLSQIESEVAGAAVWARRMGFNNIAVRLEWASKAITARNLENR